MKRKLLILALAVGLIGGLLATAGVAIGQTGEPVFVDRGWLLLDTSDDSEFSVTWHDFAGTEENPELGAVLGTQTFPVDRKCNVETPAGDNLIAITQTGSTFGATGVGALSHGLGVKTKNNCSTEQGQIALEQTLTVALGSGFNNTYFIKSAEVDVEGKRNAKLGVTYSSGDAETITLSNSSDNGPDSGAADNNIATLVSGISPFRSVTLEPVANGSNGPAVSIEGGGDGLVAGGDLRTSLDTNASVFELVQVFDGVLDCGESTPTDGGGDDAAITVLRGGQEGCVLKPYNQDAALSSASFEPVGQADAEFTATIVWPPETSDLPVPVTKIDFGDGPVPVQWCTGTAQRNPDGTLSMYPENPGDSFIDYQFIDPPELPSDGAPWCLLDQNVSYVNGGNIQVTEYYYGTGDPFFDR